MSFKHYSKERKKLKRVESEMGWYKSCGVDKKLTREAIEIPIIML
jgi:hypothetical protein